MMYQKANLLDYWKQWMILCVLLILALAQPVKATDSLYENDTEVIYNVPGDPPLPLIDVTNFVNTGIFSVNFGTLIANQPLFETYNTLNYTNSGTISVNTGFEFDQQVTNAFGNTQHRMGGNFYNSGGTVSCGSLFDLGATLFLGQGELIVNTTNVVINNGGTGDVGPNGLLRLTGENMDLRSSVLTIENTLGSAYALYAGFGLDTNAEWNAGTDLQLASALPSLVRIQNFIPPWNYPFGELIPFPTPIAAPLATTPYLHVTQVNSNSIIYRSVFVENTAPDVTYNVYIDAAAGNVPGTGAATVEFVGTYNNPATGVPVPEYLYVRDDYAQGANNPGINPVTGIPNNFTIFSSPTPLFIGQNPEASNFQPFTDNAFSNNYSYADVQLVPTTVATNITASGITNYLLQHMPGRVEITADKELDMAGAQISGENYVWLAATNQFDGSSGAAISAPYSDINVAVTNGDMTVTNLLEPTVPAWTGQLQCWNTRWTELTTNFTFLFTNTIDTNTVPFTTNFNVPYLTNSYTVTNDYRVLIVANQAIPTTPSAVQNLTFHATNSLVISDTYNVLRSFYSDARSLTLTANSLDSPSPDGELNLQVASVSGPYPSSTPFSWPNSTPNLRYLTNNGVIQLPTASPPGSAVFGSATVPYVALINNGVIADAGAKIWANNFVNSGDGFLTGLFYNFNGMFSLVSQTALLDGGYIYAGTDVSLAADSVVVTNTFMWANKSLTLMVTNSLTDLGAPSGNFWYVGNGSAGTGLNAPVKPTTGDLLGTIIYDIAPVGRRVKNIWSGQNLGATTAGFVNNMAIGELVLDSLSQTNNTAFSPGFVFGGSGANNAIYVDELVLLDYAGYNNRNGSTNLLALSISNNMVIYYAQAIGSDGTSIAQKIDGFNGGRLRWIPAYTGYFSSASAQVRQDGTTNYLNAALAHSSFFLASRVQLNETITNTPLPKAALTWNSFPGATNSVLFTTNLNAKPVTWTELARFVTAPGTSWPATNTIYDPITNPPRFYKVSVWPSSSMTNLPPGF